MVRAGAACLHMQMGLQQESTGSPALGHSISLHLSEGLPLNYPGSVIARQ